MIVSTYTIFNLTRHISPKLLTMTTSIFHKNQHNNEYTSDGSFNRHQISHGWRDSNLYTNDQIQKIEKQFKT